MPRTLDETVSRVDPAGRPSAGRGPQLVLLLEGARPLAASLRCDLGRVDTILIGRGSVRGTERTGLRNSGERQLSIRVPDPRMSSSHVLLRRLHGRWVAEDRGSKNGTLVNGARITSAALADLDQLEVGHAFFLFREDVVRPTGPEDVESSDLVAPSPELVTFLEPLREQLDAIPRVAPSAVSVLLLGESGTGKEVVARAIHRASARPGAFVAVNCGSIPRELVEAELFGAKKGAYSGAERDREGLIKAADGGTLFLDELGDLPEPSQAALLRVLQQREVMPVGGSQPTPVDFRLIAATHRDLGSMVASGRFRGDLFARVNGMAVRLPPLRERREDLGLLIASLLRRLAGRGAEKVEILPAAARALISYDWPFNVRELEKALETALVLSGGSSIDLKHLPEPVQSPPADSRPSTPLPIELSDEDRDRRSELIRLLEEHRGNLAAVSRDMGKARMQIHRWLKRYQIDPDRYR